MNGAEFGDLIKASNLSLQEVADEMGVSKTLVHYQVQGKRTLTPDQEEKIVPYLRRKAKEQVNQITETLAGVG